MIDRLNKAFGLVAESNIPRLSCWYLDTPAVIPPKRYAEFHQIQRIIYMAIHYYIEHYHLYRDIVPQTDFVENLLKVCAPYTYRPGTYRPDFLLDGSGAIKICEIGARFPLNGYFLSGIAEMIGRRRFGYLPHNKESQYARFLSYLFAYWGEEFDTICVLKGADRPGDIKFYVPMFENMGIKVVVLSPSALLQNKNLLHKSAVINELNQMEIEGLPVDIIEAIAASNSLNDLRSIFLIHDKRFMALMSNTEFLSAFLTQDQIKILNRTMIPTFTYFQDSDTWAQARTNKDEWILKHRLLGKSEKVYAGCYCSAREWADIFNSSEIADMVLQPFIKQRRISSSIGDKKYDDYAVGTLLCFDNYFFGPGIFRTSSCEITNRVDDRKMAPCIIDSDEVNSDYFYV